MSICGFFTAILCERVTNASCNSEYFIIMATKKYIKDYRLVEELSEKGRIKTTYEYIGDDYIFTSPKETVERSKKTILIILCCQWALFFLALLPSSSAGLTMYVLLPFVFSALPLGIFSELIYTLWRAQSPMEHFVHDKLENRFRPSCLFAAGIPAAAILCEVVSFFIDSSRFSFGDIVFTVCAAGITALSLFQLRQQPAVKTVKAE